MTAFNTNDTIIKFDKQGTITEVHRNVYIVIGGYLTGPFDVLYSVQFDDGSFMKYCNSVGMLSFNSDASYCNLMYDNKD